MRKRMFAFTLCIVLVLALMPAAVSATGDVLKKNIVASVGQSVQFSCELPTAASIASGDASALRELGLTGSVDGKQLTVTGTAEKAGDVRMQVSDVVLSVRVTGPVVPPKTGDENTPLLFMALALLSLTGLAVLAKKRRA